MSEIVIVTKQQRLIIDPPTRTVAIMDVGPAGPIGITGPPGPTGPTGPAGSVYPDRNRLINGGFDVWQRGAGPWSANSYTADQWFMWQTGSGMTVTRQAFALGNVIAGYEPTNYLRAVVASVAGAGNNATLVTKLEGVRSFAGQTVTLSFWAKADAPKFLSVELEQYFGATGTPSTSVPGIGATKIAITTTWTRYTVTIAVPSIAGKILGTSGTDVVNVLLWLDAGSSHNARTASLGQQSGTFDIWGVQLEPGAVATPFEVKPIGDILARCHRYFRRITGDTYVTIGTGFQSASATLAKCWVPLSTPMRVLPTVGFSGVTQIMRAGNGTGVMAASASLLPFVSRPDLLCYDVTHSTLTTTNEAVVWQLQNNAAAYVEFSAEL